MHILSVEKLGDFAHFADIFGAQLTPMTPGYAKQTFVGATVDYTVDGAAYVDIQYRASIDGTAWSDWGNITSTQFSGRYVQIRLLPRSADGIGNIGISGVHVTIDVPDIEETLEHITLPAAVTRITYKRVFSEVRSIAPYTQDNAGQQATCSITNQTNKYFDICILDATGEMIPGLLQKVVIRGY